MTTSKIALCLALLSVTFLTNLNAQTVTESSREIPLAYDVDVVVVGGTTRGVAAALAAKKAGASVFVAAPKPYLGEDMCATYRLWLNEDEIPQSPLARAIFSNSSTAISSKGLKYSYTADVPSDPKHKDTKTPSLLRDSKFGSAGTESVQYNDNVKLTLDLGAVKTVKKLTLLAYQRTDDFVVGKITVYSSVDKKDWTNVTTVSNPKAKEAMNDDIVDISTNTEIKGRYLRVEVSKAANAQRLLLGEIHLEGKNQSENVNAPKIKRVTTPMNVKSALDDALINNGVKFLFGSYITDVLVDSNGKPAGIVMTNRSGRQAVRAKVLIDATDRGIAARIAGAKFTEYPAGKQKFSRIVLDGEPGDKAVDTGLVYSGGARTKNYKVYEYNLEIDMKDSSWASFSNADQLARNMTWQTGQTGASEILFQVPPDSLKSRAKTDGDWSGAEKINLDSLKPEGVDFIYVLGGCADISRQAAEQLMRPLNGMDLGTIVGEKAATEAKARNLDAITALTVKSMQDDKAIKVEIGEMLNGLRSLPTLGDIPKVKSPERALKVLGRYDTIVIGGGTGGAPAGIGAARGGAKTLVVEYLHGLGGVGTLGRISKYYHGNRVGFTAEIDKGVVSMSKNHQSRDGWNIEAKMEWLRNEIVKAGGDVWFNSLGAGSVVRGKNFVGAVVVTPHGRGVVLANTVIDSTGNSVIPACAGVETQSITGEHISVQGTGLPPYTPGESYKNSDWTFTDDDDVLDMWRIHVVGRKKYAKAFDQGQLIDTRARRRIVGDITVSPMDIINKRIYPDIITVSKSNFDNHGFSSHSLFMITPPDKKGLVGNVPYRALLPKGYDGILVTGLGMSAHGDAMPVMRMQPDVQNQGYAAGKASAMAAENGTSVRDIDIKVLQNHLVEKDIIPKKYVGAKDSYPYSTEDMLKAVKSIGKDYSGISVVMTDANEAIPLLKDAYKTSTKADEKLRYAHVLGMLYDGTGVDTLIDAVSKAKWDKGWNFRGMGQFGATTSYVDNLVIALGRTGDKKGLSTVLQKLSELTPSSEFSHSRAVSMALEIYKDPKAAKPLADFLNKPGISGHSFVEIKDVIKRSPASMVDNSTRNNSLRELIVARALYRCGDYEGLGEKILKAYAKDYRGHYARHAKSVLQEGK